MIQGKTMLTNEIKQEMEHRVTLVKLPGDEAYLLVQLGGLGAAEARGNVSPTGWVSSRIWSYTALIECAVAMAYVPGPTTRGNSRHVRLPET